jgi:hypothetical protein
MDHLLKIIAMMHSLYNASMKIVAVVMCVDRGALSRLSFVKGRKENDGQSTIMLCDG